MGPACAQTEGAKVPIGVDAESDHPIGAFVPTGYGS